MSQAILFGRRQDAGSVARILTAEIEAKVLETVRRNGLPRHPCGDHLRMLEKITIAHAGLKMRRNDGWRRRVSSIPSPLGFKVVTPTRRKVLQHEGGRDQTSPNAVVARRAFIAAYGNARSWIDRLAVDSAAPPRSLQTSSVPNGRFVRRFVRIPEGDRRACRDRRA